MPLGRGELGVQGSDRGLMCHWLFKAQRRDAAEFLNASAKQPVSGICIMGRKKKKKNQVGWFLFWWCCRIEPRSLGMAGTDIITELHRPNPSSSQRI